MSEIDSKHKLITPGEDPYSRAIRNMTPAGLRRWEILRLEAEVQRAKAEVQRAKAEIQRCDAEIQRWREGEIRATRNALQLTAEVEPQMRDKVRRLVINNELFAVAIRNAEVQSHSAKVRRFAAKRKAIQIALWEAMPEGSFWGDVIRMDDKRLSNQKRIEAMDRLFSNYFKVPIHPRRWERIRPAIIREITREAEAHKFSYGKEFRQRERSSIYMARSKIEHFTILEKEQAIRSLGRALNNAFTEDILGSDWRQKRKQREFIDEEKIPDLSKIELRLILKRSDLTEREVELLSLRRRGFSYEEMAARLSASPNALSTAHHRAMEKLKKLVS